MEGWEIMAHPPFEEPILPARPTREEGFPGESSAPVPKTFPTPLMDEEPLSESSPSRFGSLSKVLIGIGLVGGMLGIGAFVGVVVLLMSRVDVPSRLPPTGTPVESGPHASGSVTAPAPVVLPARPNASAAPENQNISPLGTSLLDPPWGDSRDRTQVLLQMEVVEVNRHSAEELLRPSHSPALSKSAATILEAMLRSHGSPGGHGSLESAEKGSATPSLGAAPSGSGASVSKVLLESSPSGKSPSKEDSSPKVPHSTLESPSSERGPSLQDSQGILLKGGNHTEPFLQRGVGFRDLPSSHPSNSVSSATPDSGDGAASSQSAAPSSKKKAGVGSLGLVPSSDRGIGTGGIGTGSDQEVQPIPLPDIPQESMEAGLEELQRQGVARRVGTAKLAVLHRWPTQIELAPPFFHLEEHREREPLASNRPEMVPLPRNPLDGSSSPGTGGGFFSSGKLHCLPELDDEDRFHLELLAEFLLADHFRLPDSTGSSENPDGNSKESPPETPTHPKPFCQVFPKIACPAGRWVVAGGTEAHGGPTEPYLLCVVVRGEVQQPREELARVPLSESELRERSAAQCRYLESLLRARFPQSRIQLSLAAGKIFVYGQTLDWRQMEEVLAVVRRRAVEQWKVHEVQVARSFAPVSSETQESPVVNMLQVAQVRVRVQLMELGPEATAWIESGKADHHPSSSPGGFSAETRAWLQTLTEMIHRHRAMVIPAPSAKQWEELVGRKFAKVLCAPQMVTPSGQKETLRLDSQGELLSSGSGVRDASQSQASQESRTPSLPSEHLGPESSESQKTEKNNALVMDILPELAEGGRLRLEVAPALQDIAQAPEPIAQSGVVAQARLLHIQAVLQPGEVLLVPVGWDADSAVSQVSGKKPNHRFLLVSADALAKAPDYRSAGVSSSLSETVSKSTPKGPVRKAEKASYEETFTEPSGPKAAGQEEHLRALEEVLTKLFPHSEVRLRWEGDRLMVEGQAASPAEASQILAVVRAEALPLNRAGKLSVVSLLRVMPAGPMQYVMRVRFVAVDAARLRRAADRVKRESPTMVRLAGTLLELAEQGGHLLLEPPEAADLGEKLRQAEQMDLVRLMAQPTFGVFPGQPADYLLPIPTRPEGAGVGPNAPGGDSPSRYLFWRLLPRWTDVGRWQLEMIIQNGGSPSPSGKDPRSRLVAEMEAGQTSAVAIPEPFWPGPGRLVVLTTPEIRTLPVETSAGSGAPGAAPSSFPVSSSSPGARTLSEKETPSNPSSSSKAMSGSASHPLGTSSNPSGAFRHNLNLGTPTRVASEGGADQPISVMKPRDSQATPPPKTASQNSTLQEESTGPGPEPPPRGLLPNLTRFFRPRSEQKNSSPPGYTLLEAPDPPDSKTLEITVPDAPQEKPSRSAVLPRILRPSDTH